MNGGAEGDAELLRLLNSHAFGVASRVAETRIVCLIDAASKTAEFLGWIRDRFEAAGTVLIERALTRRQEKALYGKKARTENNHTCVQFSAARACEATREIMARAEQMFKGAPDLMMHVVNGNAENGKDVVIVCCLRTVNVANTIQSVIASSEQTQLRYTGRITEVGSSPIFEMVDGENRMTLVIYGGAGKIKLKAPCGPTSAADFSDGIAVALALIETHSNKRFTTFNFADCVNYNRYETTDSLGVRNGSHNVIERITDAADIFLLHVWTENQGALRIEVDVKDGARLSGKINVFVASPSRKLYRAWDTAQHSAGHVATVRVNVTGRFTFAETLNQMDLLTAIIGSTGPLDYRRLQALAERRTNRECVTVNQARELERLRQRMSEVQRQLHNGADYPPPLVFAGAYKVPTPAHNVIACQMCLCTHDRNARHRGASCAVCGDAADSACVFAPKDMLTSYRKLPGSTIYKKVDRTAAAMVCSALGVDDARSGPTANKCCTSCFQQNNRRSKHDMTRGMAIHPNLAVVLRLLFLGHPGLDKLRRRNQIKPMRRFVRLLTGTVVEDGCVFFTCRPAFRCLLEHLTCRWVASSDAIAVPTISRRRGKEVRVAYRPLGHRFAAWTPQNVCNFRQWCMRCCEQHWHVVAEWQWQHDIAARTLGRNVATLAAPRAALALQELEVGTPSSRYGVLQLLARVGIRVLPEPVGPQAARPPPPAPHPLAQLQSPDTGAAEDLDVYRRLAEAVAQAAGGKQLALTTSRYRVLRDIVSQSACSADAVQYVCAQLLELCNDTARWSRVYMDAAHAATRRGAPHVFVGKIVATGVHFQSRLSHQRLGNYRRKRIFRGLSCVIHHAATMVLGQALLKKRRRDAGDPAPHPKRPRCNTT